MRAEVRSAIEAALGERIRAADALSGGDINEAYAITLDSGERLFAKTNARASPAMFPAEARGLAWLSEAAALRVPRVVAVSSGLANEPAFLVLEYVESRDARPGFDEALGRGLAALHRHGAQEFGFDSDNFIGRLPQPNGPLADWASFYRERRLRVQLELAERQGRASNRMRAGFERLFSRLDSLVGSQEPAARLHGDLWGGNLHVDERGEPCLIDPAVYGGHREVDLAMMRLFGGFGPRVYAAYEEAFPLSAGHEERVGLYQLYPLMVHVNLFGGGYMAAVERSLEEYT